MPGPLWDRPEDQESYHAPRPQGKGSRRNTPPPAEGVFTSAQDTVRLQILGRLDTLCAILERYGNVTVWEAIEAEIDRLGPAYSMDALIARLFFARPKKEMAQL